MFLVCGLQGRLFHLSMSAPCFHVRKMWRSAERRFVRHVCLRNPLPLFFVAKTFNSWRHQKVGEGGLLSCESSSNIARVDVWVVNQWWIRIIFRRTFSVPKICPRSFQVTHTHARHSEVSISCGILQKATKQWKIVEIDLLATLGWKWGCHPVSCPCWQNVTQCQTRFFRHVCFRNPFLPFLFGIPSIHSLLYRQHAPPALHYCIMPIPPLQLQKRTCLMQRSRGFGHGGVVVSKICYNTVMVLPVVLCKKPVSCREAEGFVTELSSPNHTVIVSKIWITGYWLCSHLRDKTSPNQWTIVEIELLATVGWKWDCPAFQLPMFTKCDALPKRGLCDMFV